MYTKSSNVERKPSLSALKRQNAALKRALAREAKIAHMISLNKALTDELSDRKYQNRTGQ